jgi:hypothetical protein
MKARWGVVGLGLLAFALLLAACGGAATTQPSPATEPAVAATTAPPTQAPAATEAPAPFTQTPIVEPTTIVPTTTQPPVVVTAPPTQIAPTAVIEERMIELEWPSQMRLGESDIIRIALIPSREGYTITTEFPEHQIVTNPVPVERPGGYGLSAIARLDAIGFRVAPEAEIPQGLPLDQPVTWRWTVTPVAAGQQRLTLSLKLLWTPLAGNPSPPRETVIYSKGLTVQVISFLGMTIGQAAGVGVFGAAVGAALSLPLAAYFLFRPRPRALLQTIAPNAGLVVEAPPTFHLSDDERTLLRALFHRYSRVTLEAEFRSGYSGARTFLALPVRADGRADAYTIAKLGERDSIQREFENYETFVKDTLPPMTARIQETPVTAGTKTDGRAAVRYTFISEPTRLPISLRESLISNPQSSNSPALLEKLFSTFGPNWWMQRKPYTFRLAQEYDRMLPAHFVLEPTTEKPSGELDGRRPPAQFNFQTGAVIAVTNLRIVERRPDGKSLSLQGAVTPGQPPLRVRWNSLKLPEGRTAKVFATRDSLLCDLTASFDRFGLPDPLAKLPALLDERLIATQSTIHGDLNLENILVGPGGFVWLIDFAQTRDGHPLYDFAHLEAGIIAQVIAPQFNSASKYLPQLDSLHPLRATLHDIAKRCLFNPSQPREYHLALFMACVGALKYVNLNSFQKHILYLTAAHLSQQL